MEVEARGRGVGGYVGGDSDAGDRWGPTATPTAADRLTAVRARGAGGGAERQREPGMVKP